MVGLFRPRTWMPLAALLLAGLTGGCVAYPSGPAYPGYPVYPGYAYGYDEGLPYYGGAYFAFNRGYYRGWHGGYGPGFRGPGFRPGGFHGGGFHGGGFHGGGGHGGGGHGGR